MGSWVSVRLYAFRHSVEQSRYFNVSRLDTVLCRFDVAMDGRWGRWGVDSVEGVV
jgi:hypothetical protein